MSTPKKTKLNGKSIAEAPKLIEEVKEIDCINRDVSMEYHPVYPMVSSGSTENIQQVIVNTEKDDTPKLDEGIYCSVSFFYNNSFSMY